ncbi:MAG: hypothetical protein H7245_12300 [Candidatus Saccharibacteria bacterium]|nr:hypothetical protein [Pseudorhodobacter sp.]
MTPPLLLHVGYHKTATTWMQRLLFTPRHGYHQIADHAQVFRHIVQPHGLTFDPGNMQALITERLAGLPPDTVPVISSEILSGHPFHGGYDSDVYAERLHRIAPQARILISIRSQLRILPSVYMQYLLRGGTMPWPMFFQGQQAIGYFGFAAAHFEYDRLVAKYQALFGAQNVFLMTQESLGTDMDAAAAALATFAGNTAFTGLVPEARKVHAASYPEYAAPVLRRINQVQSSVLNPAPVLRLGQTPDGLYRAAGYVLRRGAFKAMLHSRKPVTDYVRANFTGQFTESNRRLAACTGHAVPLPGYD